MRKILALLLFITLPAFATTYNVTTSSNLQTVISGTTAGDTVNFAAGTYNITAPLTLKCGVTYSGPVVTPGVTGLVTPTAILNATYSAQGGDIFNLYTGSGYAAPCTQPTTIEYFNFENEGGIYVQTSFTNLSILYNQFTNIACCNGTGSDHAITFDGAESASNTAQNLTNTLVQYNAIGDSTSCTSPTNGMNYTGTLVGTAPNQTVQDQYGGNCTGITSATTIGLGTNGTSTYGLKVLNNNFFHVGEAMAFGCSNPPGSNSNGVCEPASSSAGAYGTVAGSAFTTQYVTTEFNDYNQIHRMAYEEQPQITGGIVVQYNSEHDWYNPYFGSFGQSFACCDGLGANIPYSPYLIDSNNLIMFNVASNPSGYGGVGNAAVGYMVEGWGYSASYTNNLWESGSNANNVDWGYGGGSWTMSNNTLCGAGNRGIANEFGQSNPPTQTGNSSTTSACTAVASVAPTISPSAGNQTYPLTVTLTDPGYTSGAVPQGNHTIWYTTDGSTPVPGSGTAKPLPSGGTFVLPSAGTVKAVGMWGAPNQPTSYAAGYGFSPSATVSAAYTLSSGAQYYLSPSGSDSNNGTSPSTPWLSPNHALNCGDVITAASGTYSSSNFASGKWGTVTCPSSNNVAWLQCATFDTCKITSTSADAMWISKSYWGVTGWETSVTGGTNGACYHIGPTSGTIHHIIMANDIANVCQGGGFTAYDVSTSSSVDYIVYVGNIAYNAASGSGACYSGFNIYQPIASDTNSGTHMYVAGNFSFDNSDGDPCAGTAPTDGEGFNFDTFSFSQGGGTAYAQQAVFYNNISVFNGSNGYLQENNTKATTYMEYNTSYGNLTDLSDNYCTGKGEIGAQSAWPVTIRYNLAQTGSATGCAGAVNWALELANNTGTGNVVNTNWLYSAAGNTVFNNNNGSFAIGSNTTGTSPAFANPVNPPAPSCGSFASVPACMATVIANYTPGTTAAKAYGRQAVSNTSVADPLFPTWLCNGTSLIAGMPSGLVTPGCGAGTPPTLTSVAVSGSAAVNAGATDQLTATGTYSDSSTQNVTSASSWSSSATNICTVGSSTGLVTGVAAGTCIITATDSGQTSPGFTVTVSKPLTSIAVTGTNTLIAGGSTSQLTATGTYSDSSTANITTASTWSSTATNICTVGATTGIVTPVAAGTCNITASDGGKVSPAYPITVNSATITSIAISGNQSLTVGQGTSQLTATGTFSNGSNSNVTTVSTWSSSNTAVCTVTSTGGLVTPVGAGTCNITAVDSGVTSSPTFTVTVTAAAPPGNSTLTNIQISGNVQFHQ